MWSLISDLFVLLLLFSLFSDTPSIYIGGMWTGGSRLREEGAMSSQREGPLQARGRGRFWPEAFDRMDAGSPQCSWA
jgi:hypothetical protein